MKKEFKLAAGVKAADLSGISEGYSVAETGKGYTLLTINVSAERLQETFLGLAEMVSTPGFAVIEIPTDLEKEKKLRKSDKDPLHRDVYYLDGIDFGRLKLLFVKHSWFFLEDGQITFGFGCHKGHDEVFISRYKILNIYADEPDKYVRALQELGYERREPLKTVWDNFSENNPGSTEMLTKDGKSIYSLVEELEQEGLYFAEHREQP